MRREIRRARRTSRKRDEERGRDDEPGLGFEVYGLVRTRTSFRTRDKGREFSSSRERSELSFFLGSYGPRSGTGATQSYWRHEVVLAAEGDWRISSSRERSELSISLNSPRFLIELSRGLSRRRSYQQPTTHNQQRLSRAHAPPLKPHNYPQLLDKR